MQRLGTMAVMALGLPGLLAAQRGGMAGGGFAGGHAGGGFAAGHVGAPAAHAGIAPRAFAAAPRTTMRASSSGPTSTLRVGNPVRSRTVNRSPRASNFSGKFGDVSFNDVPGLGFDFPHLAAISGGRHRHRFDGFFGGFPFFDGGFLFGAPSVIIEQAPPAQAQPEPEDAIAGDAVEPARRATRPYYEVNLNPAPGPSAPQPEEEQYVFVCRDGELLFAVAYSWDSGMLRYITPDGVRRSVRREALDLQATEQFNEQRGVNFHAPA